MKANTSRSAQPAKKIIKISRSLIERLVKEEKAKLIREGLISETLETGVTEPEKVKAEEVEADEYADTLALEVDYIKALKIQEAAIYKKLTMIREAKASAISRLNKKVKTIR